MDKRGNNRALLTPLDLLIFERLLSQECCLKDLMKFCQSNNRDINNRLKLMEGKNLIKREKIKGKNKLKICLDPKMKNKVKIILQLYSNF